MIDERELQSAIAECVDNPSSANVCQRLASYYIIQDHLFGENNAISENNYIKRQYSGDNEVLPAYDDFVEAKRLYQQGNGNEKRVIETLNALLIQIKELIQSLYVNSNTETEKSAIIRTIEQLNTGNL